MVLGMREGYHGAHSWHVRQPVRHLHVEANVGLALYGSQPGMRSCSSGCGPWMSRPSRTSLQVLMGVRGHARASAWLSAHLERI